MGWTNVKMIPVGPKHFALVDDSDFDRVSALKWHPLKGKNTWYAARNATPDNPFILMHRFILGDIVKGKLTDHQDGNGLNNQRHNIRPANRSQNAQNSRPWRKRKDNIRFKGVYRHCSGWRAVVTVGKKYKSVGTYDTQEQAALAYDSAASELYGEFARLNFQ
jgi:hypothetical protein